jgi:MFS transporter, DHA2 family, multidrug resistance protein
MGSADASKGGAAGALEATGYELGTGLGITFFDVFISSVFSRAIELPQRLSRVLAERASRTIGDTYIPAGTLPTSQASTLIKAGKVAFSQTRTLLMTAALVAAALCLRILHVGETLWRA